ncbi:MAG TPA: DUF3105 domain-containing protein [Solirubrobacter sp.]|nr:DUF3105 domain-containing protein [Solirubrobacter sp.]
MTFGIRRPHPRLTCAPGALLAYAVAWLVPAGAAIALVLALSGDGRKTVSVPPVQETELAAAAGHGDCDLRSGGDGRRLNPPVDGPRGRRPPAAGFYDRALPPAALTAAIRHGIVVIQFRPGTDDEQLDALHKLQEAVPEGTIVAPNATRMPYELAVTAYHHLLGCPRFTPDVLDAVQLFRGRYLGSGPES